MDRRDIARGAREIIDYLGFDLDPKARVSQLSAPKQSRQLLSHPASNPSQQLDDLSQDSVVLSTPEEKAFPKLMERYEKRQEKKKLKLLLKDVKS